MYNVNIKATNTTDVTDASLISITVNGHRISTLNSSTTNYSIDLPTNTLTEFVSVIGEPSNKKSTVSVEGNTIINKSALIKITVIAENKTSTKVYYVNVQIKDVYSNGSFKDIKTADFHSLLLKDDGTLYSFGENSFGQLGVGTDKVSTSPLQVKGVSNVIDFDTSNSHSIAATSDGSVWVWGLNDYGQLNETNKSNILTPIKVDGLYDIVKVRAGNRFSLALDKGGTVWYWGYNPRGQFDDELSGVVFKPTIVKELKDIRVTDIETGDSHFLALTDSGTVYAWGNNEYGQIGDESLSTRYVPTKISSLSNVKYINAKGNTSSCITGDGSAWLWGDYKYSTISPARKPEKINGISYLSPVSVEVNSNNIVEIGENNTLYSWGVNKYGQLANGNTIDSSTFSNSNAVSNIVKVATSPYNIFMIDKNGYVYATGRNEIGQLGIGSIGSYSTSVQRLSLFNDSQIDMVYASRNSGEVDVNTSVKLATDTLNGKIYYTTDGSDPTDKSNLYSKPLAITEYTMIKAVTMKDGKYSAVSTFEYFISNKARTEMNVTIGSKNAEGGSVVEIPITFSNVPSAGIYDLDFAIRFNPQQMYLYGVTAGELITSSDDFSYSLSSDGTISFSFYDTSKINTINKAGTFATLKFYVNSGTVGRYGITKTFISGEGAYLKNYSQVNVYYNDGYIDTNMLYGDVDGDKKVTVADLQYVQRYVLKKISYFPGTNGTTLADVDKDGSITSSDIELIKKMILKGE
jgi:alpha-tubulin suppressor-like RCC1 family protein